MKTGLSYLELSTKAFDILSKSATEMYVKGFASIEGIDRHGDNIPVKAFNVEEFMKNPQLWLNHGLYNRPSDGMAVPIGSVEKMHIVEIIAETESTFAVKDMLTGLVVDSAVDITKFLVKAGDKGLWVVAKIVEPAIIELVESKRINGFSWQGSVYRNPNGTIKKIDMIEVSLVYVPANARALLMIGKDTNYDAAQRFALTDVGLLYVLKNKSVKGDLDNDEVTKSNLRVSESGSAFVLLLSGATGHFETKACIDVTTLGEALTFAEKQAADVAHVVLLKNAWEADEDGNQIYTVVANYDGAESKAADVDAVLPEKITKRWSEAYMNDLPDDCFAYVELGGKKDAEGKTTPRALRRYPFKNHQGEYDSTVIRASIAEARTGAFVRPALTKLVEAAKAAGLQEFIEADRACPLTKEEQLLLGVTGEIAVDDPFKEGGENMEEVLKQLSDIATAIAGFDSRLATIEEEQLTPEKKEDTTKADATPEVEPEKAEQKAATPEKEEAKPNADVEKAILLGLSDISAKMSAFDARLTKMESTPATSKQADDDDSDDGMLEVADEAVRKALNGLDPAERKRIKSGALASVLFGETAQKHRG